MSCFPYLYIAFCHRFNMHEVCYDKCHQIGACLDHVVKGGLVHIRVLLAGTGRLPKIEINK